MCPTLLQFNYEDINIMQASNTQYRVTLGKSLKDMEERLTSYGVKEGCKLMMIGKRVRVMFLDVT